MGSKNDTGEFWNEENVIEPEKTSLDVAEAADGREIDYEKVNRLLKDASATFASPAKQIAYLANDLVKVVGEDLAANIRDVLITPSQAIQTAQKVSSQFKSLDYATRGDAVHSALNREGEFVDPFTQPSGMQDDAGKEMDVKRASMVLPSRIMQEIGEDSDLKSKVGKLREQSNLWDQIVTELGVVQSQSKG